MMSLVTRLLRRWGFVRLRDYGLVLTDDGRVVPLSELGHHFDPPSWELVALPIAPVARPIPQPSIKFSDPGPVMKIPASPPEPFDPEKALGIVPAPQPPDEDEEWQWKMAVARAKADTATASPPAPAARQARARGSTAPPIPMSAARRADLDATRKDIAACPPAIVAEDFDPTHAELTAPSVDGDTLVDTQLPQRPLRVVGTPAPLPRPGYGGAPLPRLSSFLKPRR